MPTIEDNISMWENTYAWDQRGDGWSKGWGGVSMQWYGSIFPRIHSFLPTGTALEIGPGFGRWTHFLRDLCTKLILVDLSEKCIEECKRRFDDCSHITCFVNDGRSLDMIPDDSLDFVFSFDSLVHVEEDVISAYVTQFSQKLKQNGVAFIHHSNLGEYSTYFQISSLAGKIPKLLGLLRRFGIDDVTRQWRAPSMSANIMASYCEKNDLKCISQELITWSTKRVLIDCISIIVRRGSVWERDNILLRNTSFMSEASYLSQIYRLYGTFQQKGNRKSV
jgi:2-polyprenyl-3-methyl-5-hydroxy-6-metoxy-1,4-benzoquinol methylase